MAMQEAEVRDEDVPEAPRRKTPLWIFAGLGGAFLTFVVGGVRSELTPEVVPVKEPTERAAPAEGSSLVRALEQQRRGVEGQR